MKREPRRSGAVPIYARIYEDIRSRIRSGEWKVGDRIESERRLAERYKVSVMTVRQAIAGLERDGLVERRRGSGTYVSAPRINWNRLTSFSEEMNARGIEASSRLLSTSVVRADDATAAQLQIATGAPVARIERLRLGGGEPFSVEACLLALDRFPRLLNHRFEQTSLFHILENEYEVRISRAEELVEAQVADKRIARLLCVRVGSPVLHLTQVLSAADNHPVALSNAWYRADRHHFRIVRARERETGGKL